MTYRPPFIVIDFETEENGHGSTEFYRTETFRVVSAAVAYRSKDGQLRTEYLRGEAATLYYLERVAACGIPLVAHNAQFEMGVIQCRYPSVAGSLVWHADTMRLVQCYDNGGDKRSLETFPTSLDDQLDALERGTSDDGRTDEDASQPESLAGLGLVKSVRRILRRPDHKNEAHGWLRENVPECKKGKEGSFLNRLPDAILERYNVGDAVETLYLYEFITQYFDSIKFNWKVDHSLYFNSVRLLVDSKVRGVPVERERLERYRCEVEKEISEIGQSFCDHFREPIRQVERDRLLAEVRKRKTLRGRKGLLRRLRESPTRYSSEIGFNVGSNKQLEALFVAKLGIQPQFKTDKGAPSFRSAVLSQWGEGGEMLKKRRKRLLVLKQAESLLSLTAYDGRWHLDLKACGTATGRFAGGSNV